MLKKRLIFTLLYDNGYFILSRNFRLQQVGNADWLKNCYNFEHIAFSIDELILLNVSRNDKNIEQFSRTIRSIVDTCFIPVAAGGGIYNEEVANILMHSGADKLVINTSLIKDVSFVKHMISKYGSQCIIASVDYKIRNNKFEVYIHNGTEIIDYTLTDYLKFLQEVGVGEIYLNSMDRDGTGQGFVINELKDIVKEIEVPVILAGGAGKIDHFLEAMQNLEIDAVATANLFNFIGNGFPDVRKNLLNNNINLAMWNVKDEKQFKGYLKK